VAQSKKTKCPSSKSQIKEKKIFFTSYLALLFCVAASPLSWPTTLLSLLTKIKIKQYNKTLNSKYPKQNHPGHYLPSPTG